MENDASYINQPIPNIDLKHYALNAKLIQQLPERYARRFRAILLADNGDNLLIGMVDPYDLVAYDELYSLLKRSLSIALVDESALLSAFDLYYRHTETIHGFAAALSEELHQSEELLAAKQFSDSTTVTDATVAKLVNSILEDAVQMGASDVHIEPDSDVLRIRQRVDGVLQEYSTKNTEIAPALAQRLKLMAHLNIAERRLPQDGSFRFNAKKRTLDVRLSTLPVQYGESIVLRLLDSSATKLNLDELGMPSAALNTLRTAIHMPHGMILVTGPVGSGKTTTLYSILNELNSVEKEIITIEDPIEYHLPHINQTQVNPAIDLTFARILRSVLRQDPDAVMIGEIRDKETSNIALRAAITGSLVLATLHTNDAVTCAVRLLDLGNEGYLVASAIRLVLAQRLLRRLCTKCQAPYSPTKSEQEWLNKIIPKGHKLKNLHHGKGCIHCNHTGYKGRIGVFELLELNESMCEALRHQDAHGFVQAAQQTHYKTLLQSAIELLLEGVTTPHEIWRVMGELGI